MNNCFIIKWVHKNWKKPEYRLDFSNGFLISIIYFLLFYCRYPLEFFHILLKNSFSNSKLVQHLFKFFYKGTLGKYKIDLMGLFTELWVIFWVYIVIFIIMPWHFSFVFSFNWTWIIFILLLLRFADYCYMFLDYFLLFNQKQELLSLARSFLLLIVNFFEVAAYFTILHLKINHYQDLIWDRYYETLKNMLTIGTYNIPDLQCTFDKYLWGLIHIFEPLYTILFITIVINKIMKWEIANIE
ncbi:MAG: hypothetical protein WCT77_07040 [Bacteroidota bacterium]